MRPAMRARLADTAGYSLVELITSMGLLTLIIGATLGGLSNVMKGNELVMSVSGMNNSVRAGLDLMIRDLLQVGSGLPSSHAVSIPSGDGSEPVLLPGPPGTSFATTAADLVLPAVFPRSGAGPIIDGNATDVLTVLMADNAFLDVLVTSFTDTSIVIVDGPTAGPDPDLGAGPDRVVKGQLMMISKGSFNTLVQVTDIDVAARRLTFADGDSLKLNQSGAANGSYAALNLEDPLDDPGTVPNEAALSMRISRLRMITYYIDATTDPEHPRLVRRVNNGDWETFDNNLGTAVALDAVNLQFAYDISNGTGNPGNVEMGALDKGTTGACAPAACAPTQIRKVNILLTSRAENHLSGTLRWMLNTLESQVSLRSMAFVDRYQ